jgi:hypothetical protein
MLSLVIFLSCKDKLLTLFFILIPQNVAFVLKVIVGGILTGKRFEDLKI